MYKIVDINGAMGGIVNRPGCGSGVAQQYNPYIYQP